MMGRPVADFAGATAQLFEPWNSAAATTSPRSVTLVQRHTSSGPAPRRSFEKVTPAVASL